MTGAETRYSEPTPVTPESYARSREYFYARNAQWAGEDNKPFPQVPKDVFLPCWRRYSWQMRHHTTMEQRTDLFLKARHEHL
jgi:hypothetical protein